MAVFTLSEAALSVLANMGHPTASATSRRAARPVRRNSIEAGSFEHLFFAAPAKGECDRLLRAARDALDAGRRLRRATRAGGRVLDASEHALAALTAGAVRVFEELCALARVNNGRVYPSYDRLAAVTALGRATVARGLQALEAAGFLVRRRRFVRVEGEGASPRYAQTSNAYRLSLPRALGRLLPHWRRPPPVPVDAIQHALARVDALATMDAGLSAHDLARTNVDGTLGAALARLGATLDRRWANEPQRESHDDPEPNLKFIETGSRGKSASMDKGRPAESSVTNRPNQVLHCRAVDM